MLTSSAWYEGNTTYDRTKRSIKRGKISLCGTAETYDLNDDDEDHSLTTVGHWSLCAFQWDAQCHQGGSRT